LSKENPKVPKDTPTKHFSRYKIIKNIMFEQMELKYESISRDFFQLSVSQLEL
jgi:hypothetical protein